MTPKEPFLKIVRAYSPVLSERLTDTLTTAAWVEKVSYHAVVSSCASEAKIPFHIAGKVVRLFRAHYAMERY